MIKSRYDAPVPHFPSYHKLAIPSYDLRASAAATSQPGLNIHAFCSSNLCSITLDSSLVSYTATVLMLDLGPESIGTVPALLIHKQLVGQAIFNAHRIRCALLHVQKKSYQKSEARQAGFTLQAYNGRFTKAGFAKTKPSHGSFTRRGRQTAQKELSPLRYVARLPSGV
jgi:hypothetical protein